MLRQLCWFCSILALFIFPAARGQDRVLRRPLFPVSGGCDYVGAGTLTFWYKLDAQAGLSDGDPIDSLSDSSGNGVTATGTTTARPTYRTNQINGLPAASFDGNDCFTGTLSGALAQPNVLFIVGKELTGSQHMFDGQLSGRNLLGYLSGNTLMYAGAVFYVTPQSLDTWRVYEAVFDGASSELLFNGVSKGIGNAGSGGLDPAFLIGTGNGFSNFFQGYMAEVLFYDSITSTNRATIRACLQTKYGL